MLIFLILFLETVELFYPIQPEADIRPRKFQPNINGVWKKLQTAEQVSYATKQLLSN